MLSRVFVVLITLTLYGCDISQLSAKLIPDNIEAMAHKDIDAALSKNSEHFKFLQGEMSDETFEVAITDLLEMNRGGTEISRNIVSANVSKNASLGEGTSASYQAVYEIHSTNGYTVIELLYQQTPQMKTCCELSFFNMYNADSSPYYEMTQQVYKFSIVFGLLMLFIFIGIAAFVFKRRKTRTE